MKTTCQQTCGDCFAERLIESITRLAPDLCVSKYCLRKGGGGWEVVQNAAKRLPLAVLRIRDLESIRCVHQRSDVDGLGAMGHPPDPRTSPLKRIRMTVDASDLLSLFLPLFGAF